MELYKDWSVFIDISPKLHKNKKPHSEAVKKIYSVFKKEWLTSYDYKKQQPLHYQSQKAPGQLFNAQTIQPILYLTKLTHAALYEDHSPSTLFSKKRRYSLDRDTEIQ